MSLRQPRPTEAAVVGAVVPVPEAAVEAVVAGAEAEAARAGKVADSRAAAAALPAPRASRAPFKD